MRFWMRAAWCSSFSGVKRVEVDSNLCVDSDW
jgi:hypothetical protein